MAFGRGGAKPRNPVDVGCAAMLDLQGRLGTLRPSGRHLFAAEPMMRAGPAIAARTASRIVATRGATSVRPPMPKTCR